MKKICTIFSLFFVFFSSESFAKKSKIFLGINGFNVSTSHFFDENAIVRNEQNETAFVPYRKDTSASNLGAGISAGFIGYYRKWFVAPEAFFDYLNNHAPDFFASEPVGRGSGLPDVYKEDEIVINHRFGAKVNVGYNVFSQAYLFGTLGFAVVDYDARRKNLGGDAGGQTTGLSYGGYEVGPLFGGGLNYEVNKNLILQAAYDFQRINARYVFQGFVDVVDIHVTKLGVLVTF